MKKHRCTVLELSFLLVFCMLQAGYGFLWDNVQRRYTGYLITIFHIACAVLLGIFFWAATKLQKDAANRLEKGMILVLWSITALAGLPYPLFWIGMPEVSSVLIGFSWLIAVWHLLDFLSFLRLRKGKNKKSK